MLTFIFLVWLHKNWPHHLFSHYNFTHHYNFFNIIFFHIIITISRYASLPITHLYPTPTFSYTPLSLFHGLLLSHPQRRSLSHGSRSSFSNPSLSHHNQNTQYQLPQVFFLKSLAVDIPSKIPLYLTIINCLSSLLTTLELINCPLFKPIRCIIVSFQKQWVSHIWE